MKRVVVQFGAYGDIADFEITENVTEDDINSEAWDLVEEFASTEWSWRIEEDEDED